VLLKLLLSFLFTLVLFVSCMFLSVIIGLMIKSLNEYLDKKLNGKANTIFEYTRKFIKYIFNGLIVILFICFFTMVGYSTLYVK